MNLGTLVRAFVLAPVATGLLFTSACSDFGAERAVALVVVDAKLKAGRGADGRDGVAPAMADGGPTAAGSPAPTGSYDYPNNGLFPYPPAPAGGYASPPARLCRDRRYTTLDNGPGGGAGGCGGLVFDGTALVASSGGRGGEGTFGAEPTPGESAGSKRTSSSTASSGTAGLAGEGAPAQTTVVRVNAQTASIGGSTGVAKDGDAF